MAKMNNATFEGIKPNVPRFFRIGFRFERIPGRSASFLQKWHFAFLPLLGELADRPGILSNRIPIRTNPGTIGLIDSKMAFRNFDAF